MTESKTELYIVTLDWIDYPPTVIQVQADSPKHAIKQAVDIVRMPYAKYNKSTTYAITNTQRLKNVDRLARAYLQY